MFKPLRSKEIFSCPHHKWLIILKHTVQPLPNNEEIHDPATPTDTEGNALIPVQHRKNAVPTQPHTRSRGGLHNRVKNSSNVIFTETPGGIADDSPPPSLTSITDAQL